jgi:hypothetical protein
MSERRACRLVKLARSVFRYVAHPRDDSEIQTALSELAAAHPEFGFRKMFLTLRRLGHLWNLLSVKTESSAQTQKANSNEKSVAVGGAARSQSSLVG